MAAVKVSAGLEDAACEAATFSPTCAAIAASAAADVKVPSGLSLAALRHCQQHFGPYGQGGMVAVIAKAALSRIDLVAMAAAQHSCPDSADLHFFFLTGLESLQGNRHPSSL